ncbi:MAG TPA: hypothetical protein VNM37_22525, partial [Candidatus Dormibacteraeota bacterium]|nr:hypothetical protein [Candidatus Dormibacteraeota bacterium]
TVSAKKGKAVRGLPLALEDIADIRVMLTGSLHKDADDSQITVAGPNDQTGASVVLSEGTIYYIGGGGGGGGAKKSVTASGGPPAPSWFVRHVNFLGTVSFGRNVSYTPVSIWSKITKGGLKLFTDKAARRNLMNQFSTKSGATAGILAGTRDAAVEFDVRIKEGSSMMLSKIKEEYGAEGKLELEPGSKINLILPSPTTVVTKVPFTIVDDPGKRQEVSFPGGEFGLRANVTMTAEKILFDHSFQTPDGPATVDELRVLLTLVPRTEQELLDQKRDEDRQFLNFKMSFSAEPDTVTGQVEAKEGAGPPHPVTIRPSQADLFTALTGADAATGSGDAMKSSLASAGVQGGLNFVLRPIKWALGLIGFDIGVKESSQSKRRQPTPATTPGDPGPGSTQPSVLASALQSQEMTVGRQL